MWNPYSPWIAPAFVPFVFTAMARMLVICVLTAVRNKRLRFCMGYWRNEVFLFLGCEFPADLRSIENR